MAGRRVKHDAIFSPVLTNLMTRRLMRAVICAVILSALCFLQSGHVSAVTYNVPPDPVPYDPFTSMMMGPGDVLNVFAPISDYLVAGPQSEINFFSGAGSSSSVITEGNVNFLPGSLGTPDLAVYGGNVVVNDGNFPGAVISGGHGYIAGGEFYLLEIGNATVDFVAGMVTYGLSIPESTFNWYGGSINGVLQGIHSELNIHSGPLTDAAGPSLNLGGDVTLYMKSATLNGAPIQGLSPGSSVVIADRNAILAGTLEDGSSVDMLLSNAGSGGRYQFASGTTIRVTLIPEPSCLALALVWLSASLKCRTRLNA